MDRILDMEYNAEKENLKFLSMAEISRTSFIMQRLLKIKKNSKFSLRK